MDNEFDDRVLVCVRFWLLVVDNEGGGERGQPGLFRTCEVINTNFRNTINKYLDLEFVSDPTLYSILQPNHGPD